MSDTLTAGVWKPTNGISSPFTLVVIAATYVAFNIVQTLYDVYFGPLSKVSLTSKRWLVGMRLTLSTALVSRPKAQSFQQIPSDLYVGLGH